MVCSAAWDPDGPAIAWGNTPEGLPFGADWMHFKVGQHNTFTPMSPIDARTPLERAFRLSDLQFTDAPQASFRRPGAVDLTFTKSEELMLAGFKQGDEQVAIWKITRKDKESNFPRINCFARVAGGCAVVGVGHELIGLSRSGEIGRLFLGHTATVWAVAPSPDGRLLLSASADQTLKIWSLERVDPLLTLFFADSEWVAWTPQGYYAASPGGEQLMGWHVNNGLNAMASYYPASQFRKTLHRPDVIKRLLKAGSLEMALAEADTARGEASRPTAVAQVLPPKVAITTPADAKLALSNDTLEVQAVATSVGAYPVTALRLLLDGRPAPEGLSTFPNPKLGEARGSWTVAVPPGSHRLIVQADSEVSKGLSEPIEVTRGSGDAEPGTAKGSGTLYLLAIGINDYPDKRLKLDCAAPDARALRQAF
ncbi:MAG TPA: hypothetical protein VJY33_18435, partial [Isosphaeraceae bacterium]|nr:hypothetical protein [Isosphaeraceae bacterium]